MSLLRAIAAIAGPWVIVSLLLAGVTAGCGREYGWDRPDEPGKSAPVFGPAQESQLSASWARRDDPAELERAIRMLERRLAARGGADYATLVQLSRASLLLGELRPPGGARTNAYAQGMRWGDLALRTFPAFRERFEATHSVSDSVQVLGKEAIDAIYWDAVNIAKWAKAKSTVQIIFYKDKVRAMVERVLALDETWYFGAAHRYLGAYWAGLPSFAGRDLASSRRHFERAISIAPRYLVNHTYMADYYARNANDRALFQSELELVLRTAPETVPDFVPEQRVEKRRAKELLDGIDDSFDAEERPSPAPAAAPGGGS